MNVLTRRELTRVAAAAGAAAAVSVQANAERAPARSVELEARPGPFRLDTQSAGLIVVDMQNDFGSPGGMFHRAGIDISGIQRAVAPTAQALAVARRAGLPIVYLKMGYRPDLSDLGDEGSANRARHLALGVGQRVHAPDGSESRILIRDTWNTDIVAGLTPQPEDIVLYKTRFSGFYDTDLHERLGRLGIKQLVVTGCTTSICVESTVRDAMFRDYRCVLLGDCMSEPIGSGLARSNHEASLVTVETSLGWVSSSAQLASALG